MNKFELFLAVLVGSMVISPAIAQQANIGVPFGQANSSFFEQSGVGFNIRGPGFFFQQNSFGQALPQFGGFDPGAGANFGFGLNNGRTQANFNFAFGQGSRQSFVSQTPSVTIGNGGFGAFSAGSWTPFVVGAIPVVGDAPAGGVPFGPAGTASPLEERLSRMSGESSERGSGGSAHSPASVPVDPKLDPFQKELAVAQSSGVAAVGMSVAQIQELRGSRQQQEQQAKQQEIDDLVSRADSALEAGKPAVAKIYLQQAFRRAEGDARQSLEERIRQIDSASQSRTLR